MSPDSDSSEASSANTTAVPSTAVPPPTLPPTLPSTLPPTVSPRSTVASASGPGPAGANGPVEPDPVVAVEESSGDGESSVASSSASASTSGSVDLGSRAVDPGADVPGPPHADSPEVALGNDEGSQPRRVNGPLAVAAAVLLANVGLAAGANFTLRRWRRPRW